MNKDVRRLAILAYGLMALAMVACAPQRVVPSAGAPMQASPSGVSVDGVGTGPGPGCPCPGTFGVGVGVPCPVCPSPPPAGGGHDADGATVARHLQERYADTVQKDCGSASKPALLCSGVLLRVTRYSPTYRAWNPNPGSSRPGGVSFSWLRKDANFNASAYGLSDGYILLPKFYADDDGYTELEALCVFPFDGATNDRGAVGSDGCGAVAGYPGTGPCQAQGITTAAQWVARFGTEGASRHYNQCGFTVSIGTPASGTAFAQVPLVMTQLSGQSFPLQNEVMIRTWAQNDPRIPLEAFFYMAGSNGLTDAKRNQQDFSAYVGRWVPVIRLTLATSAAGNASFTYRAADQAIP